MSKEFDEACEQASEIISIQDMTMAGKLSISGDLMTKMGVLKAMTNKKTIIALGSAKSGKYGSITIYETKQNIFMILYLFNSNADYFSMTTGTIGDVNKIVEKFRLCYMRKKTPNIADFKKYVIKQITINN